MAGKLRKSGKDRKNTEKVKVNISCLQTIVSTKNGIAESLVTCTKRPLCSGAWCHLSDPLLSYRDTRVQIQLTLALEEMTGLFNRYTDHFNTKRSVT